MRLLTVETISSGRKAGFDCFAPLYDLVVAVFCFLECDGLGCLAD
jgi:hypothetical protein